MSNPYVLWAVIIFLICVGCYCLWQALDDHKPTPQRMIFGLVFFALVVLMFGSEQRWNNQQEAKYHRETCSLFPSDPSC